MSLLHLAVLAIVQGITEFLPISSSGHLILVPELTGWPDQGLAMDVAVHVGTLVAVLAYFHRDVWSMMVGLVHLVVGRRGDGDARLVLNVIIATVPTVIAGGALVASGLVDALRSVAVIGATMLGFGVVLYVADMLGMTMRRLDHMTGGKALLIGLSQVLALIPGTSRAGITITAARMLGFERREAARFSMLVAIPTILGAGVLQGGELWRSGDLELGYQALLAAALAFVSALIGVAAMMAWLQRASFTPFVIYRMIVGAALLAWAFY